MHPNSPEPEWLALADAQLAPPRELSKARRKSLSSTGHLIERFAAACDRLRANVSAGFMPDLQAWLSPMDNMKPCSLKGDGLFINAIQLAAEKFQLRPPILPAPQAAIAVELWNRAFPDKAQTLPPLLPFAELSVNSPIWPALLHLRPMRDFWDRELRRSAVDNLLGILPRAWLFDPSPLPPGAVIPGIELASWSELAALGESQRMFVLTSVTGAPGMHQAFNDTINHAASPPKIMAGFSPPSPGAISILSYYGKIGARVDWLGAIALTGETGQHRLHRIE